MADPMFVVTMKIAIRDEGDFVVAYHALSGPGGMWGDPEHPPVVIATWRRSALDGVSGLFEEWQDQLRRVIEQACKDTGLPAPEWDDPTPAPANERTGRVS